MVERYTRLYALKENLYAEEAPIIIKAGALLKDNETGSILAQIKFENISQKTIIGLKVKITAFDMADRMLGEDTEYQYLDISAISYSEFGSKNAIPLPDNSTRSFNVSIAEVIFNDKSVWVENVKFEPIEQKVLHTVLKDSELVRQYQIKTNSDGSFVPEKYKDLYICSCGKVYKNTIDRCPLCGNSFSVLTEALNIDILTHEKEKIEQQKREAEVKAKDEQLERNNKITKFAKIIIPIVIVIIIVIIVINNIIIPASKYRKAVELISESEKLVTLDDYKNAFPIFKELQDYKGNDESVTDIRRQIVALWGKIAEREVLSAGGSHTVGLKSDGTVSAVGYNKYGRCDVEDWTDIIAVSAGGYHTIGLKSDGTVVAVGSNENGQCNVENWTGIVSVSAGDSYTVGLKADGTVVAVGNNDDRQCNVDDWTDIVAVSAGVRHTVGLKADGTVVTTGYNKYGQCDVNDWADIISVSANLRQTVGLKSNGTVVAVGENYKGLCDVQNWSDIVAVSAGLYHTVGLKSDGIVVAAGSDQDRRCDVQEWSDIVAASAGSDYTVGLKSDGTVIAIGNNSFGECDVSGFTNIKLPQ